MIFTFRSLLAFPAASGKFHPEKPAGVRKNRWESSQQGRPGSRNTGCVGCKMAKQSGWVRAGIVVKGMERRWRCENRTLSASLRWRLFYSINCCPRRQQRDFLPPLQAERGTATHSCGLDGLCYTHTHDAFSRTWGCVTRRRKNTTAGSAAACVFALGEERRRGRKAKVPTAYVDHINADPRARVCVCASAGQTVPADCLQR